MKTSEINTGLIGKRVQCVFTGLTTTGIITDIIENTYSKGVEITFDNPVNWGGEMYKTYQSTARKDDEFGNLQYTVLI